MQDMAGVAQTRGPFGLESVGIDTGDLGRHVGPDTHLATRERIGQGKGLQGQIVAHTGQQGIEVLHQRRKHLLIPPGTIGIEQPPAQLLQTGGLGGQEFFDAFRQQPAVGETHRGTGFLG